MNKRQRKKHMRKNTGRHAFGILEHIMAQPAVKKHMERMAKIELDYLEADFLPTVFGQGVIE